MTPKLPEECVTAESSPGLRNGHYSVTCDGLPPEFQKIAERELNETEDGRIRGIQHLKEYMKKEKLPSVKDEILLAVLRHSKYNLKKAEAKLKTFIEKRKSMVQQLQKMGMDKIESILRDQPVGALPFRDREGRVITYSCPYRFDLEKYGAQDVLRIAFALQMFFLTYPTTSVTGFVHFAECKSPSASVLIAILNAIRTDFHYMVSFPYRVARVEVLNENYIFRCFVRVFKSVISTKIVGRFAFHGSDSNSLHKKFHPDILPYEFGGNMGPLNNESYKQQLIDFIKELLMENP